MTKKGLIASLTLAFALLSGGCDRPLFNMTKLERVRGEAYSLMKAQSVDPKAGRRMIPQTEWPPVIASLHPRWVTVSRSSVDIVTKPFLDGGWGYNVPRYKRDLPMPPDCYSEPSKGVYWHGPC